MVAAPSAVAKLTITEELLGLDRLTVNDAFTLPELPSVTLTSLIES